MSEKNCTQYVTTIIGIEKKNGMLNYEYDAGEQWLRCRSTAWLCEWSLKTESIRPDHCSAQLTSKNHNFTNYHYKTLNKQCVTAAIRKVIRSDMKDGTKVYRRKCFWAFPRAWCVWAQDIMGAAPDNVCSAPHGVRSIVRTGCIHVHSVDWSEETGCRCIQPRTFKESTHKGWQNAKPFIWCTAGGLIRRAPFQTVTWNSTPKQPRFKNIVRK